MNTPVADKYECIVVNGRNMTHELINKIDEIMQQIMPGCTFTGTNENETWYMFYNTDNKLVGNMSLNAITDHGLHGDSGLLHILTNVCVRPDLHRQGIGTYMMNKFESWCIDNDIYEMILEVDLPNDAAVGLYTKMGYEIIREDENEMAMYKKYKDEYKHTTKRWCTIA